MEQIDPKAILERIAKAAAQPKEDPLVAMRKRAEEMRAETAAHKARSKAPDVEGKIDLVRNALDQIVEEEETAFKAKSVQKEAQQACDASESTSTTLCGALNDDPSNAVPIDQTYD